MQVSAGDNNMLNYIALFIMKLTYYKIIIKISQYNIDYHKNIKKHKLERLLNSTIKIPLGKKKTHTNKAGYS